MASKIKRPKTHASTCLSDFVQNIQRKRLSEAKSVMDFKFNNKRARFLSTELLVPEDCKGVVYWMFRDCRVQDNWAFLFAQKLALKNEVPLHVCFCLLPKFLDATYRHFHFLLKGLEDVAVECSSLNIYFHLLEGSAQQVLPEWVKNQHIGAVVCDFSPLRLPVSWCDALKEQLPKDVPFIQVDAHNIVPCWAASDKLEFAARTIRKKITSKLDEFLTEFPPVIEHPFKAELKNKSIDWDSALESRDVDKSIKPCEWAKPGTNGGLKMLEEFCNERLKLFASKRNDPTVDALSNLSPWFHFGQVSSQRAVLCVQELKKKHTESVNAFCEEAIVRRELSDNFCFYNQQYDNIEGTTDWARATLSLHSKDKRSHIYTLQQFEKGKTHDDLWNSAHLQLVEEGKIHGFLRMYWAKKILEWTPSPETALEYSIYLNDRYSLDGRDPTGYVGCMSSICGVHDPAWKERDIFGKIRYISYEGCKRKFDIEVFVKKYGGRVH